jgi:hypothetical protein
VLFHEKKKKKSRRKRMQTKHTAAGIPTWSPTVVLICRSTAYVWQSGRDAQFSADCGRMCLMSCSTWYIIYLSHGPRRVLLGMSIAVAWSRLFSCAIATIVSPNFQKKTAQQTSIYRLPYGDACFSLFPANVVREETDRQMLATASRPPRTS